jgi:hypothetical protein
MCNIHESNPISLQGVNKKRYGDVSCLAYSMKTCNESAIAKILCSNLKVHWQLRFLEILGGAENLLSARMAGPV